MTPLGGFLWRLIADTKLTPEQRHQGAWDLWRDAPVASVQLVSKFSVTSMRPLWDARASQTPTPVPEPDPTLTAPIGRERALEVGGPTWGVLMGMMSSFDIGVNDPVLDEEIVALASAYEGDAVFMFGYFGLGAMSQYRAWRPESFETGLRWIESQVKEIDAILAK
jgi:hypothetical protein